MRVLGLAFAVLLAVIGPIAAHDNGPRSNMGPVNSGPAPGIVPVWHGRGSGGHSGAIGGQPTAGHVRQWNGGWVPPNWGPSRYYGGWGPYGGLGVPTYWVWGPSGGAFDYPFSDWRGPTGGWGNP
jgi:hypothetical protein